MRSLPERERDRDVGRLGGIARGARPAPPPGAARRGIAAGLVAGIVFGLSQAAAGVAMGGSWTAPLRASASLLAGHASFLPGYPLSAVVVVGLVVFGAVSAFWGAVFAALASWVRPARSGWLVIGGGVFGALVGAIDRHAAFAAWPWLAGQSATLQFVWHALFYGVPLGLAFGASWRRSRMLL